MPAPATSLPARSAPGGLAELERLSAEAGQPELASEIRRAAETLARHELTVAVLGQFKRGKSSLLNALAGYPALPTGILPTTSVATCLVRGSPGLRVLEADGGARSAPLATIASYVSEQQNPGNVRGIARVEVSVPMPPWTDGVTFVDSPGVGSAHEANTEAARALLPTVDVAVFVLSPDPPITAEEVAFLARAREHAAKFLFVVNKIDLVDPADRPELVEYLRRLLRERCGFPDVRLHLTSAKGAGVGLPSGASPGDPGVVDLLRALREQLGERRSETVGAIAEARVARFGARLGAQIELALRSASLAQTERGQGLRAVDEEVAELRTEHRAFQALLATEVRSLVESLPDRIDRRRRAGQAEIERALEQRLAGVEARTAGGLAAGFDREFRASVVPFAARIHGEVTAEVSAALEEFARRLELRLARWSDRLRSVVSREFGVDLPPLTVELEPLGQSLYRDRVDALFEGTLLGQTVLFLPSGALRRRLRRRLPEIVDGELEAQAGRIRSDLADRAAKSWAVTEKRSGVRLERDLALVEEALRAGERAFRTGADRQSSWRSTMEGLQVRAGAIVRATTGGTG